MYFKKHLNSFSNFLTRFFVPSFVTLFVLSVYPPGLLKQLEHSQKLSGHPPGMLKQVQIPVQHCGRRQTLWTRLREQTFTPTCTKYEELRVFQITVDI